MLGRVTQRSIALNSLTNLQNAQSRTAKLQEQMTSQSSLSKGSDDSVRAAAALRLNDQIAVNSEYSRNVSDAQAWMTTQEGALDNTVNALQKVRDLTVQAGNGSLNATGLKAIADQIREIKNTVLGDSNTQYQGRAVFAGTANETVAYGPRTTAGVTEAYHSADDQQAVLRTVSAGVPMQVNVNGDTVYGPTAGMTDSLFAQLDTLADDIEAGKGGAGTVTVGTLDRRISLATGAMAKIGAKTNQLDQAEETNAAQLEYLQNQLEDVSGIDVAKTYLEFNMQNVAYQAALQATAKVIQPTLLDFLR